MPAKPESAKVHLGTDGNEYVVYAGGQDDNPALGGIIVTKLSLDPCKDGSTIQREAPVATPSSLGAVSILSVGSNEVTLKGAAGGSAVFNYITSQLTFP
jgi:hypothetical protein